LCMKQPNTIIRVKSRYRKCRYRREMRYLNICRKERSQRRLDRKGETWQRFPQSIVFCQGTRHQLLGLPQNFIPQSSVSPDRRLAIRWFRQQTATEEENSQITYFSPLLPFSRHLVISSLPTVSIIFRCLLFPDFHSLQKSNSF
jgi:hypothetical protein